MRWLKSNWLLLAAHAGAWLGLAAQAWLVASGRLSANPIQDLTFRTGKLALLFLVLSLACTPAHTVFGSRQALRARKWLGLYAFLFATVHFLIFAVLDYGLEWGLIQQAVVEKRYVLAGLAALLILIPLALTSTRGWMRRLGKAWKRLHRFVYLAGALAVLHYVWLVKVDVREPLAWGAALAVLLVLRVPRVRAVVAAARMRMRAHGGAG
jgi:sulfoxide reductase heme-binding subunit YedZ